MPPTTPPEGLREAFDDALARLAPHQAKNGARAVLPLADRWPPTCWRTAALSAPFRSGSDTPTSARP